MAIAKTWWQDVVDDFLTVRSLITLGAFGVVYFLVLKDKAVPDVILQIVNLLLGFWFGQKASKINSPAGEEKVNPEQKEKQEG